jgi:adenylate cyclase
MQRRLAAVLNADVVGYSRLMSTDEAGTLRALKAYESGVIDPTVAKYRGRIVKRMGDGYLAEFASVVDAVECALAWQIAAPTEADKQLKFRMGVHLGDIIAEGDDIYGDGVNIAARLEALSQPGCVTLSDDAFRQVRDRVKAEFHDLGEQEVKNIPHPLRVWEWRSPTAIPRRLQKVKLPALDGPSIVIMRFRNLTGDPEKDYLTDGLRMDIQKALVKVSGLFLIASGSAYAFPGSAAQDAACALGAKYALEGSVRTAGQKVRVTTELTEAASGRIIWSDQFDRTLDDSFDLQDEITARRARGHQRQAGPGRAGKGLAQDAEGPEGAGGVLQGRARVLSNGSRIHAARPAILRTSRRNSPGSPRRRDMGGDEPLVRHPARLERVTGKVEGARPTMGRGRRVDAGRRWTGAFRAELPLPDRAAF